MHFIGFSYFAVESSTTCSSAADMKAETSFGPVGIYRQGVPLNLVGSRRQGFEPNPHDAGADPGLALIDPGPIGVAHLDRTEGRLELLGE